MQMSRRTVDVRTEVGALERAFAGARPRLFRILSSLPEGATLDDAMTVERIPNHFVGACHAHCPLAPKCEAAAREAGDPAVLGEAATDALGPVGSIPRLMAMIEGREVPADDAEARVVRDFLRVQASLHTHDRERAHAA